MNSHSPSAGHFPRRQFLATSAAATATLVVGGTLLPRRARAARENLRRISLNGEWQVSMGKTGVWIPAQVPGCIHTDLLAAGKIPDPFYRDNEKSVQWVGETDWLYRRTFDVDAETLSHNQVILRCEGLDTLATIRINGRELGKTDNMFRTWEFGAKPLLQAGENKIEILFSSPAKFVDALEKSAAKTKV